MFSFVCVVCQAFESYSNLLLVRQKVLVAGLANDAFQIELNFACLRYWSLERNAQAVGKNLWEVEKYQDLRRFERGLGQVIEVTSGDSLIVRTADGEEQRLYLASILAPRRRGNCVFLRKSTRIKSH